jgi:hypothetical protein
MGSTVAHPLDSARLKVSRAWKHIEQLNVEGRAFIETQPYTLGSEKADGDDDIWIVRAIVRRPIPEHWSLIFGDAVHNLRSALDHIVYQSAEVLGSGAVKQTQWPVVTDRDKGLPENDARLAHVPDFHRARIASYQPFANPAKFDWLAKLDELDKADKHRVLGRTVGAPTGGKLTKSPGIIEVIPPRVPMQMEDGAEILRVRLAPGTPVTEVSMQADFVLTAMFGFDKTYVATDGLRDWSYGVLKIIEAFAPEFEGV